MKDGYLDFDDYIRKANRTNKRRHDAVDEDMQPNLKRNIWTNNSESKLLDLGIS